MCCVKTEDLLDQMSLGQKYTERNIKHKEMYILDQSHIVTVQSNVTIMVFLFFY